LFGEELGGLDGLDRESGHPAGTEYRHLRRESRSCCPQLR